MTKFLIVVCIILSFQIAMADECTAKKEVYRTNNCCTNPTAGNCDTYKQDAYTACGITTCGSDSGDSGDSTSDDSSGCDQCTDVNIMEPPEARLFACPTKQYNGASCVWDDSTSTCGCPAGDSGDSGGCDQNPDACNDFNGLDDNIKSLACQDQGPEGGGPLGCVWDDSTSTCGCPAGDSDNNGGCTSNADCPSGQTCGTMGTCEVALKLFGEPCSIPDDCESYICKNNTCATWTLSSNDFCYDNAGDAPDYNAPEENPSCYGLEDGGEYPCEWVADPDSTGSYICRPSYCEYYNSQDTSCQDDERCALKNGQCIVRECLDSNNECDECRDQQNQDACGGYSNNCLWYPAVGETPGYCFHDGSNPKSCVNKVCKTCAEAHAIGECGNNMLTGICTLTQNGNCVANSATDCAQDKRGDCAGGGEFGNLGPECNPSTLKCVTCNNITQETNCGVEDYTTGCEWDSVDGSCKVAQKTCGDFGNAEDCEDHILGLSCEWDYGRSVCGVSDPYENCPDYNGNPTLCNLQGNCKYNDVSNECGKECWGEDGDCYSAELGDGVCTNNLCNMSVIFS